MLWKENWEEAREHISAGARDGLVVVPYVPASVRRRSPRAIRSQRIPVRPRCEARHADPPSDGGEPSLAGQLHLALDALPSAVDLGPGSLASISAASGFFGRHGVVSPLPDSRRSSGRCGWTANRWWRRQLALVDAALAQSAAATDRVPDLIENSTSSPRCGTRRS